MCTYPVQPICTFSCTSVFILISINPQYTVLHILSHAHLTHFILFVPIFILTIFIYIYSLVMFQCFIAFYVIFILFLHFPLSGPVLTNISLLIIPCMIVYVTNNKEP